MNEKLHEAEAKLSVATGLLHVLHGMLEKPVETELEALCFATGKSEMSALTSALIDYAQSLSDMLAESSRTLAEVV